MDAAGLLQENIWTDRSKYYEAECVFYEQASKACLTPLAEEIAKARKRLIEVIVKEPQTEVAAIDTGVIKFLEKKVFEMSNLLSVMQQQISSVENRITLLAQSIYGARPVYRKGLMICPKEQAESVPLSTEEDNGIKDEVSEGLTAYNEEKYKGTKQKIMSRVVFHVKPWMDVTNIKLVEQQVRAITMDGLAWKTSKLIPCDYGIKTLQISAVVEDSKIFVSNLQKHIKALFDVVEDVSIACYNPI